MAEKKKFYKACLSCKNNINRYGKCKEGFDNWYYRKNKNNKCEKCASPDNRKQKTEKKEKPEPKVYTVYTDGGCSANPGGPGGYGVVIIDEETKKEKELSKGFVSTTNNRMEMMAVIAGLEVVENGSRITLVSDSQYVLNTMAGKWSRNKNIDLWNRLDVVAKGKDISLKWVRGHDGNKYNERCDSLATEATSSSDKEEDFGYTGERKEIASFDGKQGRKASGGAMAQKIDIPKGLDRGETIGFFEPDEDSLEIKEECIKNMKRLLSSSKSFKDYLKVKSGGLDDVSKMGKDELLEVFGKEIYDVVVRHIPSEKDALSALRWHFRGLSLYDSIRKVLVDIEVRNNAVKYRSITHD